MTRLAPALAPGALLLCAAACSAEPQGNAVAPVAAPTTAVAASTPAPTVTAGPVDSGTRPQPGELKTFGDWTVGCDNTKRCELRSLVTGAYEPGSATVAIARDAGPEGRLSFDASTDDADSLPASVEGAEGAKGTPALVAAMANGRRLVARAAGKALFVSLTGASAALRYTDAVQGRAGTTTALVAKGAKPASAVPAATPAPTVVAVEPGGEQAKASAAQLAQMRKAADCSYDGEDAPEYHALGGGRTLVLLPCGAGAYNVLETMFVLDGGGFKPAQADAPVGFAETGAEGPTIPTVVNGRWEDGVLTSYAKGRGLGDCGVTQEFVWDGDRLRLSRQRAMGECRGNPDFITTWQAKVVRR